MTESESVALPLGDTPLYQPSAGFETWASWIVNGGIDEQWDAYVDQLNQMGLERLMEIYQEALDVYNNAA